MGDNSNKMTTNADDPSFVIQMLEEFRSGSSSQRRVSKIVSRLHSGGSNETADTHKRKATDDVTDDSIKFLKLDVTPKLSPVSGEKSNRCSSPGVIASPWESHRIRSQLLEANIKISDLENQLNRHHSLRQEMELLFNRERDSLRKQVDREKSMVKDLENHLDIVRKREVEIREELKQCKSTMSKEKISFEERIQCLQKETATLTDNFHELELSTKNEQMIAAKNLQLLKDEVAEKDKELSGIQQRNSELEKRIHELSLFQSQFEQLAQELQNAQLKIKELEKDRDDHLEAAELVKSQQMKVFYYSELEKQVAVLKEENENLKMAVPKHLLLEEMVQDLKTRQIVSEEQAQELAWAQGRLNQLQTVLDDWNKVAQDHCEGYMSSSYPPDPAIIRKLINELQQKVHVLTADLSEMKSQYSDTKRKKDLLALEIQAVKKEMEKHQTMNEQQNNRMRLLQKKLQLVTMERDSYRSQLDSYEKDLTISSSSLSNQQSQQIQQMQQRLETKERILDGYRQLLEKKETESDRSKTFGGSPDLMEKLHRLESERNVLVQEKEQLQKRKDELEIQLEYRAIKGDFNPVTSKVLHFRMNPTSEAEAQYEDELAKLRSKCTRLEERIKLLEEGNIQDITQKVEENVASSSSQEVQELKEVISTQEIKLQRLKELFHASAKEFREVCYELFGYKIDRNGNIYTLTNMYADNPDDHLTFKRKTDGTINMMETPYSATLGELVDLHLHHHKSPPLFLGAITVELFNRQTLSQTISQTMELTNAV